ncbi:MAG: hypothetical protein E7439_00200 [Ruminococcaceae bacterium]|nr:hypothetical protein [Oscillospiraceae bacterium]
MDFLFVLLFAGAVFGLCFLADKGFRKLFRSKPQHTTGLAVRAPKRNGTFGVIMMILGISALLFNQGSWLMLAGGGVILAAGVALGLHYLGFGIFYDADSFLVSGLFKKSVSYSFGDICSQQLYVITGGSIVIELQMKDGSTVHVQSNMDGAYPFLDAAFAGWCRLTGRDPENCPFHDPANSCWFPKTEDDSHAHSQE